MKILFVGGAGGIGRNAVKYLSKNHEVTVVDSDSEALDNLDNVEKIHLDITDRNRVQEELTGLDTDILVNCAGVQKQGAAEDMEIEEFEEHIYHNYIGVINTVQASLPSLRENNGNIVNVSSIAGKVGLPMLSGYCASKYAVEGFTDSLRRELKDINVVLVEPGRVKTGFNKEGRDNIQRYEDSNYSDLYQKLLSEDVKGLNPEKAGRKLAWITVNGTKNRYTITREAYLISKLKGIVPERFFDFIFRKYRR